MTKKRIYKAVALSAMITSVTSIEASGYKLPEQSLNSVALGAAYVAHTTGADTAYYNPARMGFLDRDRNYIEGSLTLVHLPSIDFEGAQYLPVPPSGVFLKGDGATKIENIGIGQLHYVSKDFDGFRFGFSLATPGGLSKRWDDPVEKTFAEEFSLRLIEANPSISYRISDNIGIGGGVRILYADGKVKSDGSDLGIVLSRDMDGDDIALGYNLALAISAPGDIDLAVTYRSKIDMKIEGHASITAGKFNYSGGANVDLPLPASLSIAAAKTFDDRLTVEFVYERTFWSAYDKLDFDYDTKLPVMDTPLDKSWKDSNTYRIGLTYRYNDRLTLMGGYAYDETPIPDRTMGYELPDSDANIFSAGFRYRQTDDLSWGAAILYDSKKSRTLELGENENGIIGEFDDGGALLTTVGFEYRF